MRRPRRTPDQWRAIFEQHAQSSLPITTFCKREGIALSSFYRWRDQVSSMPQPSGFIEVTPPVQSDDPQATWLLEMELPGGGHLRLRYDP